MGYLWLIPITVRPNICDRWVDVLSRNCKYIRIHTRYFASLKLWTAAFCLLTSQQRSQAIVCLCGQLALPCKCLFFQEFFFPCHYYILAPHASLHLITWVDTCMTELKLLTCEGGKERLEFMVTFTIEVMFVGI